MASEVFRQGAALNLKPWTCWGNAWTCVAVAWEKTTNHNALHLQQQKTCEPPDKARPLTSTASTNCLKHVTLPAPLPTFPPCQ